MTFRKPYLFPSSDKIQKLRSPFFLGGGLHWTKLTFTLIMEVASCFGKLGVFNTGVHKPRRQVARATNFIRRSPIFVNTQYRACYIYIWVFLITQNFEAVPRFLENLCNPTLIVTTEYKKEIYVTSNDPLIKYKKLKLVCVEN